jgi:hypothetical protein
VSVGGPTRLTNVAMVRPELLNHVRDRSVSAKAIFRQLSGMCGFLRTAEFNYYGDFHVVGWSNWRLLSQTIEHSPDSCTAHS